MRAAMAIKIEEQGMAPLGAVLPAQIGEKSILLCIYQVKLEFGWIMVDIVIKRHECVIITRVIRFNHELWNYR